MLHSFILQAALQTLLQHPCASAALKQKFQLLTGAAAAVLRMYHQITTQVQALLGADRKA